MHDIMFQIVQHCNLAWEHWHQVVIQHLVLL